MPISNDLPTPALDYNLIFMLLGIAQAERWLEVALSIVRNHREYGEVLAKQAEQKFSGSELAHVRRQFSAVHFDNPENLLAYQIAKVVETITVVPVVPVEERPPIHMIAVDPELARLASGLKQAPQFRLWMIMLQLVRNTNHLRVARADLEAALPLYGVQVSKRNLRRWLVQGQGIFWNFNEQFVYFIGYEKVAHRLVKLALQKQLPDLVSTNRPGKHSLYIDVSGSLQLFEAHIYAAWLAYREAPTIARSTLSALFNRAPRILRQWDTLAAIRVSTNEAQFDPAFFTDVPEHAYLYQASIGKMETERRFRARMSNTYHSPQLKHHHERGQSRRVFHTIVEYLESIEPTGNSEQGRGSSAATGGLKPTGRRYFNDSKKARRSAKYAGKRERYIFLGADKHKRFIWDYSADGWQRTHLGEELPLVSQKRYRAELVYARDVLYG